MSRDSRAYKRSVNGMVGALIVTVLVVLAFVAFAGCHATTWTASRKPSTTWRASSSRSRRTSRSSTPAAAGGLDGHQRRARRRRRPAWGLGVLTDDGGSSGSGRRTTSVDDLVDAYVDEDAEDGDDATVTVRLADDLADLVRTPAATTRTPPRSATRTEVLVYGSAPTEHARRDPSGSRRLTVRAVA